MSKPVVIKIDRQDPASIVPGIRRQQVQRFINVVLSLAIREKATKVCFEPQGGETRVTCEVNGVIHDLPSLVGVSTFHIVCGFMVLAKLGLAYRPLPLLRRYFGRLRGDRILPPLERCVKLVVGESIVDAQVSIQHLGPVDPINDHRVVIQLQPSQAAALTAV